MTTTSATTKTGCLVYAVALSCLLVGAGLFVIGPFALLLPIPVFLARGPLLKALAKHETAPVSTAPAAGQNESVYAWLDARKKSGAKSDVAHSKKSRQAAPVAPRVITDPDFDAGPVIAEGSTTLYFEYADADGVVTNRRVTPWIEFRRHIRGYCHDAGADRTFRKDRMSERFEF